MIPISALVNVQLNVVPAAEQQRDVSTVAVLSTEFAAKCPGLDFFEAMSQLAVETQFGAASETAKVTSLFFQQSPRPTKLVIGAYTAGVSGCVDAINAFTPKYPNWYAVTFTDNIPTAQVGAVVDLVTTMGRIVGQTTNVANDLTFATSPYKAIYDKNQDRLFVAYHTTSKYAHMAALATMLAVNWQGSKTKKTLMYKVGVGVPADNLDITTQNKANALGINTYTYYGSSAMWSEGRMVGKRFFDEVHLLDWFVDAVQKNVFNALYQNPTQIDLTDAGTTKLIARVKEAARQGVRNGSFAPGKWRIDGFGTLTRGDILEEGFYVWADTVANLSDTDVENRKAPVIYAAVKLAGAVHKSDVIVGFSR